MRNKNMIIKKSKLQAMVIISLVCCFISGTSDVLAQHDSRNMILKIHLPREVSVKEDTIALSDVGILRGNESVVSRAGSIDMGRFSVPGQEVVIDRATILSRLASHGCPASEVMLTGSAIVSVTRQQKIIKSKEFLESARRFLKEHPPCPSICQIQPVIQPDNYVLGDGQKDVQLVARFMENRNRAHANVRVAIFASGKEIAYRDITFRLKYNSHNVVAVTDIPAGAVITSDNVKIEERVSDYPEPADWKPPYGQVAKRRIPANSVVDKTSLGLSENSVVVERNQTITIRIHRGALHITAIGTALQKGCTGEFIRVRNNDSKRIIAAKVCEDGTVEPVF